MADDARSTVLRRKLEAGRSRPEPYVQTVARILASVVSKTAERQMKMATQVTDTEEFSAKLSDLPSAADPSALLLMVSSASGARGLLAVSLPVLAALIERRTTGHVGAAEIPARRPTRTDAAIAAGFFDPVLEALSAGLTPVPRSCWAEGYRIDGPADDMRSVLLRLEDTGYRGVRVVVTLTEGGSRTGNIVLCLPDLPERMADDHQHGNLSPDLADTSARPVPGSESGQWSARIEAAVMSVPAEVTGALWRLSMPLGDLLALRPGTSIALPRDAVDRVPLEGSDGQVLAHGRLGQSRGYRALRLRIVGRNDETDDQSGIVPGRHGDGWPADGSSLPMSLADVGQPLRAPATPPAVPGLDAFTGTDLPDQYGEAPGEFAFGPA